jgi:hypothetical protein
VSEELAECWYKIWSHLPAGSKKDVFRLRSVNAMVIAPASTGRDSSSSRAVITTGHAHGFVEMKFTVPRIDDDSATCREKIPR